MTKETIGLYGEANSPIVLKDEFRPIIEKSGLSREIAEHKEALVEWLSAKRPETGLDAQNDLSDLVLSGEIEEFISTKALKEYLYENGKSTQDYHGILAIYLFETIIPEVISES